LEERYQAKQKDGSENAMNDPERAGDLGRQASH
jgi:hypothetical protein